MNRRILVFVACIIALQLVVPAVSAQDQKPNILFVMTDQWRKQAVGYANEDPVITPGLDLLSEDAVIFRNAYTNRPICAPSRASMFTGQYPSNHAVFGNNVRMSVNSLTLGDIVKEEGYSTAYIGKLHLDGAGEGYVPPERRHGFDYWIMSNHHAPFRQKYFIQDSQDPVWIENAWEPDWMTDRALEYLETLDDQPFCMVISYGPPHTGGGPGFEDRWQPGKRTNGEISYGYGYAAPPEWEGLYPDYHNIERRPNVEPVGRWDDPSDFTLPGYFGALSSIDENIGRLVAYLKDNGLYENTIILFTSDHGEMLGSQGRMTKGVWYEESVGIPCLISYKNKVEPSALFNPISTVDFTPTILGLAGIKVPEIMDGYDFSEALESGDHQLSPKEAFSSFDQGQPIENDRSWRSIHTERYTYVLAKPQTYSSDGFKDDGIILFDNESDPYQMNPIYRGTGNDDIMDQLHEKLVDHLDNTNDPFISLQWKTASDPKYVYSDALDFAKTPHVITSTLDLKKRVEVGALVYPNPSKDTLHINYSNIRQIDIIDGTGKKLSTHGAVSSVDISNIETVMLFVIVTTIENEVFTIKVIKGN